MSVWTSIRNSVESAAVVAGSYVAPGSSLITSNLASKGSQSQLSSTVGIVAQVGAGALGVGLLPSIAPASSIGSAEASGVKSLTGKVTGLFTPTPAPSAVLPGTLIQTADGVGTYAGIGGGGVDSTVAGASLGSSLLTGTGAVLKGLLAPAPSPGVAMPAPQSTNISSTGFGGQNPLGLNDPSLLSGVGLASPTSGSPASGTPANTAIVYGGLVLLAAIALKLFILKKAG